MFPTKKSALVQALSLALHPKGGYYQEIHHHGRGTEGAGGQAYEEVNPQNKPNDVVMSVYWIPDTQSPILSLSVADYDRILFIKRVILQLAVKSGVWKCGRMATNDTMGEQVEFTVIGEATRTGVDNDRFCWVTIDTLEKQCSIPLQKYFKTYIREKNQSSSDEDEEFLELGNDTEGDAIPTAFSPSQNRRLFQLNYEPI
ncbi:hypothetical protein MHU86_7250 [Fragilaria crotonensis]|nr:hypothetical protein MHU86_7250 [Fragilaria crotonensis]